MFDMRCEEEATVQPHSRARQEQLQLINNQLREEDDKWQDVSAGQGYVPRGGCPAPWARAPPYPTTAGREVGWVDLDLKARQGEGAPGGFQTGGVGIQER